MTRLAIDPVTRIEGHLRIEVEHASGAVTDAWSTGTMFRGIELILKGRDPRQAWMFAQRACGVCTHVHALASVRAVENALGITIPPNARHIRNLMTGVQFVHDHVIHFYHLHALDWADITKALTADPAATATLAQTTNPGWSTNTTTNFTNVKAKLQAFVDSGQLGPFAGGYWGHPAYTLSPEANLLLIAHYLEALEWQRDIIRVHTILGGKNPHPQTFTIGGMALTLAPNAPAGLNTTTLTTIATLITRMQTFVDTILLGDVKLLTTAYKNPWATLGAGPGNLLSFGEFPEADTPAAPANLLPAGRITGRNLTTVTPIDHTAIVENIAHSWYTYTSGEDLHPGSGQTTPAYTGPQPPYETITTTKYSWLKAPRYAGAVYEVGPLARIGVAYAAGNTTVRQTVDGFLTSVGLTTTALFSTLGRIAARALETQIIANRLSTWHTALKNNLTAGDLRIADTTTWAPTTWPATTTGWGPTEAPRGALGHWTTITNGKIVNYQMVVPSTWNGSPRDTTGTRGPWEQALIGTPLTDPTRPVEILRTIHSYDPCMACAVHVHTPA